MDTTTLTEALRSLQPTDYNWKFALYSTRKTRDGLELEWNLCGMQGVAEQIEITREFLLKKPVADKPVMPYSPFLSDKQNIGALDKSNELIREQLADLLTNIKNGQAYPPTDFIGGGSMPKIVGYAFYGEKTSNDETENNNETIVFMKRGNPFLSGAKFYTGTDGDISLNTAPLLKFTPAVDFLTIGGVCYFLSSAIEKDFAFEGRHFAIAQKWLDKIVEMEIIGDFEGFEQSVMTAKNARKFLDFDTEVLEHIVIMPITARMEYLEKYGVDIDKSGKVETYESEQCEFFIDLLCSRSCINPLGKLAVGSNITPR